MSGLHEANYCYEITLTVVVEGNGLHADGLGATATRKRLEDALARDPRVVEVKFTSNPRFIGSKTPISGPPR